MIYQYGIKIIKKDGYYFITVFFNCLVEPEGFEPSSKHGIR